MSETATWQPSASIPNLLKRAAVMAEIRRFFTDRGVLEVETPCMSQATVTDIHMVPFETRFVGPGHSQGLNLYLMTSPEYHMKRLLAAGCGPVFQLCRSFRNEEMGRHHNPEFTMLEWYRPCYDMYRLINEVDDLLQQVLDCQPAAAARSGGEARFEQYCRYGRGSGHAASATFCHGRRAAYWYRSSDVYLSFPGQPGVTGANQH